MIASSTPADRALCAPVRGLTQNAPGLRESNPGQYSGDAYDFSFRDSWMRMLTGGSRGIGLSCLEILLKSPLRANVVSLSRSFPQRLQELKKSHHENLLVVQGDVKNDEDNKTAVDSAVKTFSSVDCLILNSGIIDFERIDKNKSLDGWREVFEVNFFPLVSMLKHSLVHLRKAKGRVIFISSTASVLGVSSCRRSKQGGHEFPLSNARSRGARHHIHLVAPRCDRHRHAKAAEVGSFSIKLINWFLPRMMVNDTGKNLMTPTVYQELYELFESSKIVKPDKPAEVIANLAIRADRDTLTGKFLVWDDDELKAYRSAC
ncbi:hypothetical protein VP01_769g8 [Puccinia sorghi]|uniref:Uncharacterized protein n=1 Tax=Puccinia sorghi TaxID=27349 RepID=A0A0L6UBK3_9BASI|nr:hypothetical protein VP01_769g8 [Puccinia sorghi]